MLGRPTALHLFSDELPFRRLATAWLAEQKAGGDTSRIESFASWTTETSVDSLRSWTAQMRPEKLAQWCSPSQLT
jgi:hypothetical protein